MRHIPEHIVERRGCTAVQVRRAGEDRDEGGRVEAQHATRLGIRRPVGTNFVAHVVREQGGIERADATKEPDQLRVDNIVI